MARQTVTPRQHAILHFLYLYRFLTRQQLQALLGLSSKPRLGVWLKALREQRYVSWQYTPDQYRDRSKPAIYFLAAGGIQWLRASGGYPLPELRVRYRDAQRSAQFVDGCLFLADRAIQLVSTEHTTDQGRPIAYAVLTRSELADPEHRYHEIVEEVSIRPQLIVVKRVGPRQTTYLLELFAPTTPRPAVRRRLKAYFEFLSDKDNLPRGTGRGGAMLVFPNRSGLLAAKRTARSMVGDDHHALLLFTTVDKLGQGGIDAPIWEEW